MKKIIRAKFWENKLECCGTCRHVFPDDALIKPGYNAVCLVNESPVKNARNHCCEQYKRRK